MNSQPSNRDCFVCGGSHTEVAMNIAKPAGRMGKFVRCRNCFSLSFYPDQDQPPYEETYYGAGISKFSGLAGTLRLLSARGRASRTLRITKRPGRCFDMGCGDGDYLFFLEKLGYDVNGSELPGPAFERSSKRFPGKISSENKALCDQLDSGLDLVSLWQVFEHLPFPNELLKTIGTKLKPDGWLVISVPNPTSWQALLFRSSWLHLDPPRHIHLSPPECLEKKLKQNGFNVAYRVFPWLEFGPIGVIQSLFNLLGFPRDEFLDQLRSNGSRSLSRRFLYLAGAALLFFPAAAFALIESLFQRGSTYELWARIDA
jgi:SAM-dependent methyltransferase